MLHRAAALVIHDGHMLLMRRVKNGEEYYTIPGGKVEEGETPEQAAIREIKEEVNLDIKIHKHLFHTEALDRKGHHFLVFEHAGALALGGEELVEMTETNQYHPIWVPLLDLSWLENFKPMEARLELEKFLHKSHDPHDW